MIRLLCLLTAMLVFSACHRDRQKGGGVPDMGIKVARYDRLQYEAVVMNSFTAMQRMNLDFPRATKLLIEDVLGLGTVSDPNINERLCAFYADSTLLRLMAEVEDRFKDMTELEQGLSDGFRRLKKEIPSLKIPRVYAQISALNQSVVVADSLLGFSLDKYMGADYPLYKRYYYDYQLRWMTPERILPDCFMFYLFSQYPFGWMPGRRSLQDVILYRGKVNWVVCHLLDYKSIEDFLGYTEEEKEWCKANLKKMWEWMKERNLPASTDPMVIRAFTHADPSFVFEGVKVPPYLGSWLGMKLVEIYLKQHEGLGMSALLDTHDFPAIADVKF